jgi:hypothetical protein
MLLAITNLFLQDETNLIAYHLRSRSTSSALLPQYDADYIVLFKDTAQLLCNPEVKQLLVLYDRVLTQTKPEDLLAPATPEETARVFDDLVAIVKVPELLAISFAYDLGCYAKTTLYLLLFY